MRKYLMKNVVIFKISTALPVEPLTGAGWYNTWVSTQTLSQWEGGLEIVSTLLSTTLLETQ